MGVKSFIQKQFEIFRSKPLPTGEKDVERTTERLKGFLGEGTPEFKRATEGGERTEGFGGGGARPPPKIETPETTGKSQAQIQAEQQAQQLKEQREQQQARDLKLASERLTKEREAIRLRQKEKQIREGRDLPETQSERDVRKQKEFFAKKKPGVVSESLLRSLEEKAEKGSVKAQEQLERIGAFAPIVTLRESINIPKFKTDNIFLQNLFDPSKTITGKDISPEQRKIPFGLGPDTTFRLAQKIDPVIKEHGGEKAVKVEKFLSEKLITIHDQKRAFGFIDPILKFGALSPAFISTLALQKQLISTGALKPVVKVRFKAKVTRLKGDVSGTQTIAKIEVGGQRFGGVSRQLVRELPDDISVSAGEGLLITKGKGAGTRTVTKFEIGGVGKELGSARLVQKGVLKTPDKFLKTTLKTDIGKGITQKVVTQDIVKINLKEGIGLLKFQKAKVTPLETLRFNLKGKPVLKAPKVQKGEITGVLKGFKEDTLVIKKLGEETFIKKIKADTFLFTGRTGKTTTRIYKKGGIVKIIKDPNILGEIKIETPPDPTKIFIAGKGGQKTPFSKTFGEDLTKPVSQQVVKQLPKTLTKTEAKVITGQAGGLTIRAEKLVLEDIAKIPVLTTGELATSGLVTSRFKDQTKQAGAVFGAQTKERFGDLGVQETRLSGAKLGETAKEKLRTGSKLQQVQLVKETQAEKLRTLQKLKLETKQRQRLRQIITPIQPLKTEQVIRQAQKFRLNLPQKQKLQQRGPVSPFVKIPTPEPTKQIIIPPFLRGKAPSRKPRGLFVSEVRRFGKYRPVARGGLKKVIRIASGITQRGLGQTFRIRSISGRGGRIQTPRGFRKTKKPLTFREKPKFRINLPSEVLGLRIAKRRKRKKR